MEIEKIEHGSSDLSRKTKLSTTDLAIGRILPQLVNAGKCGGNDVEMGEHHTLRLAKEGVPKRCQSVEKGGQNRLKN